MDSNLDPDFGNETPVLPDPRAPLYSSYAPHPPEATPDSARFIAISYPLGPIFQNPPPKDSGQFAQHKRQPSLPTPGKFSKKPRLTSVMKQQSNTNLERFNVSLIEKFIIFPPDPKSEAEIIQDPILNPVVKRLQYHEPQLTAALIKFLFEHYPQTLTQFERLFKAHQEQPGLTYYAALKQGSFTYINIFTILNDGGALKKINALRDLVSKADTTSEKTHLQLLLEKGVKIESLVKIIGHDKSHNLKVMAEKMPNSEQTYFDNFIEKGFNIDQFTSVIGNIGGLKNLKVLTENMPHSEQTYYDFFIGKNFPIIALAKIIGQAGGSNNLKALANYMHSGDSSKQSLYDTLTPAEQRVIVNFSFKRGVAAKMLLAKQWIEKFGDHLNKIELFNFFESMDAEEATFLKHWI